MSIWKEIKKEDIAVDGDEIDILISSDNFGNNYITVKKQDVLDLIADYEATKGGE